MYILNNVFDHIYVLNLDRDKQKMDLTRKKLNKYNIKFERFPAVNGKDYKDEYEIDKSKNIATSWGLYKSEGSYGCHLSHINILKDAITKKYNNILILEDDIILHKNFNKEFNEKYKNIDKDWDIIYLGTSEKNKYLDNKQNNYEITYGTQGNFAIGINNNLFEFFLNLLKKKNMLCDCVYAYNSYNNSNIKSIILFPNLIIANTLSSTTTNINFYLSNNFKYRITNRKYNWQYKNYDYNSDNKILFKELDDNKSIYLDILYYIYEIYLIFTNHMDYWYYNNIINKYIYVFNVFIINTLFKLLFIIIYFF